MDEQFAEFGNWHHARRVLNERHTCNGIFIDECHRELENMKVSHSSLIMYNTDKRRNI